MFNLTRKTDYSFVALAVLSRQVTIDKQPVSARQIADQYQLPLSLLMNLLKDLVRAQIVTSVRGPQGGYVLAIDPSQVTLMDVIVAIEGPVRLTPCCTDDRGLDDNPDCRLTQACPIREPIRRLHARINQFLERVTLADLFESETNGPLESAHLGDRLLAGVGTPPTGCTCHVTGVNQDGR